MKHYFIILIFFALLPLSMFAQGKRTELNPQFIEYLNNRDFNTTGRNYGVVPSPVITPHQDLSPLSKTITFPMVFDLRDSNYVTPVKNQGSCGSCWTFSTLSAVESNWIINYGDTANLSENNLKNGHGFLMGPCEGGNAYMSTAYFARGSGPVSETDDPYMQNNDTYHNIRPDTWINEARFLPAQPSYSDTELPGYITMLKKAIMENGALSTLYFHDDNYVDKINGVTTYYYPEYTTTNHAVSIIGWNDTITTAASQKGAWLIKNSWGTAWGDDGYFYISYFDKVVNSEVAYWPDKMAYKPENYIYDYDDLGGLYYWGDGINTIGYGLMKAELWHQNISHIATYSYVGKASFYVEIYDDFSDGTLSGLLGTGSLENIPQAGFYTIEMDSVISIDEPNDIYIKITYDHSLPANIYPIPIELAIPQFADPDISTGNFWISYDGTNWDNSLDTEVDLCIKIFGSYTGLQADFAVSNKTPKIGEAVQFTDLTRGIEEPTNWLWDFGDSTFATEQNPVHSYDSVGIYTVVLTVSSENHTETVTKEKLITINPARLITPTHESVEVDLSPYFYWEKVPFKSLYNYTMIIGPGQALVRDTLSIKIDQANEFDLNFDLSDNSAFFWTVVAEDTGGSFVKYDTLGFWTNTEMEPPNPFELKFPASNATGMGTLLSFIWHESSDNDPNDQVTYKLQIAENNDFTTMIFEADSIETTHFVMTQHLANNKKYYWRVLAFDQTERMTNSPADSFTIGTVTALTNIAAPAEYSLEQNYPNPFNPTTTINYSLKNPGNVKLMIYNSLGEQVDELVNHFQQTGHYNKTWQAGQFSSGLYFYKIECRSGAGDLKYSDIRKMLLVK